MSPIKIIQAGPPPIVKIISSLQQVGALQRTYNWPAHAGDSTIRRIGDGVYIEQNIFAAARVVGRRPVLDFEGMGLNDGWFFLKEDNEFGGKRRFTDINGGEDYATLLYMIDHYTGLGWDVTAIIDQILRTWEDFIDFAFNNTHAGFSDYFAASQPQLISIMNGATQFIFRWFSAPYPVPFNFTDSASFYTSTFYTNNFIDVIHSDRHGLLLKGPKTILRKGFICRKHF